MGDSIVLCSVYADDVTMISTTDIVTEHPFPMTMTT